MTGYVTRRLIQTVVLLLVVSAITFVLILSAPGGPAIILDPNMTAEQIEEMRHLLGLDRPIYVQYFKWLGRVFAGDLGVSYTVGRPVTALVAQKLPATLILSGTALGLALLVAVPLGVISAVKRYSLVDNVVTVISFFGLSIPVFWYGLMLIILFSIKWQVFPSGGMYTIGSESFGDLLRHLVLPAVVLGTVNMAQLVRYTRSSVLSVLRQDYVRTARAKGISERRVLYKHALKNALIPVITVVGLLTPRIVGGAAVTEQVFAWPGMGQMAVRAAFQRDYPVIMGVTMVVSLVVILANLLIDVLYVYVDPRIRYD